MPRGFCVHGRPHRDGRRVLCFADWSREYGVPAWFNRNGYVQDVSFCCNQCLKRPDIVEVKLEGMVKHGRRENTYAIEGYPRQMP